MLRPGDVFTPVTPFSSSPALLRAGSPEHTRAPPVGKAHSLTSSHLFSLYLQLRVAFFLMLHFLSCTTKSDSNRWNQPNA